MPATASTPETQDLLHYEPVVRSIAEYHARAMARPYEVKNDDGDLRFEQITKRLADKESDRSLAEGRVLDAHEAGGLLKEAAKNGRRHGWGGDRKSKYHAGILKQPDRPQSLAERGTSGNQSSRWQKVNDQSIEDVNRYFAECRDADEMPSIAGLLRFCLPDEYPSDRNNDNCCPKCGFEWSGEPRATTASDDLEIPEAAEEFRAEALWKNAPEFSQEDQRPLKTIPFHFESLEKMAELSEKIGQKLTMETQYIHYPPAPIGHFADRRYVSQTPLAPRYPIFIVSKGRWESRLTSKALCRLKVKHHIIVEEQEYVKYRAAIDPDYATLLVLDPKYQRDYQTCDDLGDSLSKGSGPARNFAWDLAVASGAERHWCVDDNISAFFRLNKNLKTPIGDATMLRFMEDFTDRFENVAMSGPNYFMFAPRKAPLPPFVKNTRIYSCNLIQTDAPYRWESRYHEDTHLSLRMLKDGLCTIQFNACLQFKATTMTMKGGNTDELYAGDGRLRMAESLQALHPDVAKVVWREDLGRWHHYVNYRQFRRNELTLRPDVLIPEGVNDYGMFLEVDEEAVDAEQAELMAAD